MEELFVKRFPNLILESKYTELMLKKTLVKAMPTRNIKDLRGYMDIAYLFIDEADHFQKSEQEELMPAITAYEEKSNGKTILASTPNRPGGLFQRIEQDKSSKYTKLFLDYTYGLDKIYDRAFIEKKMLEPEFPREYGLLYLGRLGNLLSRKIIDDAISLGEQLSTKHIPPNPYCIHSLGVDPAFGSSAFGFCLTEHIPEHDIIRVLYAEQFDNHPDPNDMIDRIFEIHRQYYNLWIFVDASARGFITSLKIAFGENINYHSVDEVHPGNNKVLPINFSKEHKTMISHLAQLFNDHKVAVDPQFDKLVIALKTAVVNEYTLDKESTSYDDIFDAARLSLKAYKIN
jgi:hypothetical protein